MSSGDRRPNKDMRKAHRERLVQQARDAPTTEMQVEAVKPDMAGQRRERSEQNNDPTPFGKQVRNVDEQKTPVQPKEMEQDLDKMYLENDAQAYTMDRRLEKQRRFHFQKQHAREEEQAFNSTRKNKEDTSIKRIKLVANHNKHVFLPEKIHSLILATLQDVDFEIEHSDIVVTPMSATGPYVVALHKEAAEYLLEEGLMAADTDQDPPYSQFFAAKPYNSSINEVRASQNADDISMSIYFNLGAEYTGLRINDMTEAQERIKKALGEVFGEPSDFLRFTLSQPKTELGYYRNAIRAIIKYNKQNESKVEPEDVNNLSKLRYIGMGFGKRPLSANMPAGWRAAYDIEPCCFRQKQFCSKAQGKECDLRDQVWAKFSYTDKNLRLEFAEKKRKREEEQKNKRDQEIATLKQLQAERNAADCCNFFMQGKCSKNARECSYRHRSLRYSKLKITCASAKPNQNWVCAWTAETCPYAHHIDVAKD